uniref:PsbP C-terminal domain-containing protein n=1 Tax=Rhodosorus marinus TaxID=101924 RepID=A0A7S3ENR3_9RHOD|mmetsp:Transcript_8913/g.39433  ORF Transcript_8913/g.39433 Transcript_8913/m.39433 type:complete len:384 (+) Transcript_8913:286-1437(+)
MEAVVSGGNRMEGFIVVAAPCKTSRSVAVCLQSSKRNSGAEVEDVLRGVAEEWKTKLGFVSKLLPNGEDKEAGTEATKDWKSSLGFGGEPDDGTSEKGWKPDFSFVSRFLPGNEANTSAVDEEKTDLRTFLFGKEGEFDRDLGVLGSDRRRFFTGLGLSTALVLGGNLLGSTSAVLSMNANTSRALKLDVVYPVGGFKRYISKGDYEFIYPGDWVEDYAVALADGAGRAGRLDYSMKKPVKQSIGPQVAFGRPGRDSRENVSVIKSDIHTPAGFSLQSSLGSPLDAGEQLLRVAIAPEGSGRTATLVGASDRDSGRYYIFEYIVKGRDRKGQEFENHNLSVVAGRQGDNSLFTFTMLSPEALWTKNRERFWVAAESFHVYGMA